MLNQSKKSIPHVGSDLTALRLQTDTAGIILYASSELLSFTGKQQKELLGNSIKKIIHTSDKQKLQSILDTDIDKGLIVPLTLKGETAVHTVHFKIRYKKNGRKKDAVLDWKVVPATKPASFFGKPNNSLDAFFSLSGELVSLVDLDGYFKKVNQPFIDVLGYKEEEFYNKPVIQFVHPDDRQKTAEITSLLKKGNHITRFENRYYASNGDVKWLSWSTSLLQKDKLILAIGRDITTAKQQEQELNTKSGEHDLMVALMEDIIFEYDASFRIQKVWCHHEWLLNMMQPGCIGKTPEQVFTQTPYIAQLFTEDLQASFNKKEIRYNDFSIASGNGIKWLHSKIIPLYAANGSPKGFTQRITDISEKKRTELAVEEKTEQLKNTRQELKDVIERYKVFVQQSSEIIWRCELQTPININDSIDEQLHQLFEGYIAECNDQMAHFYGYENAASVMGKKVSVFFDPNEPVTRHVARDFIQQGYKLYRRLSMHIDHQGNKRYFLNNLVGVVEQGLLLRLWTTQNEITQQRLAETANRYQASVLENVFDAVMSTDQDFQIRSWNQAAEKLYGIPAADIMGHTIHEFIDLNYNNTTREELVQELYDKGCWTGEASFIRPSDGKKIVFWSSVSLLKNKNNRVTDIISINKDITERKLAEQTIRESEDRFRQFADAAPVMIWVSDEADNTIYVNKCFEQFTGVTIGEVKTDGWEKIIYPSDIPVAIEKYRSYFKFRESVVLEYRLKNAAGEYRWVLDHGVPRFLEDGTFVGYIGSVVDIHDRKLAEEKIRFQVQVMQDVSEGIISTDLDFTVISFNRAAENIYGLSGDAIIGKPLNELIDLCFISNTWEEVLTELHEKGSWEGEAWYNRHDGKRIYLYCSLSFVKNDRGMRIGFAGIYRDITEARQSQQALRINEERYRSVVYALGEGIVMHDKNGEIITCNRSAEVILGVPANLIIGQTASGTDSLCIYEDGTPFPTERHPSLITLKTGKSLQNVNMGIQRPDGTLVWISMNTEPVYYTQQRVHPDAVVTSFVDITQKKAAEIELKRSQQQLTEYSERITNILASITDGFIAVDKNLNIFLWNHAVEHITGLNAKHVIGLGIEKVFPNFAGTKEYHQYIEAINNGTSASFEHDLPVFNRWLETSVYPFSQGAFIYFRDITERKKQEKLLELEKEVLKINAQPAASLKTTVDYFLDGLEKAFPHMLCSVVMLNEDKQSIQHLSAPNLPVEYARAITGMQIGPCAGSCGTAIYRKERVITSDIATDPLWNGYRQLTEPYGLQSCWSFPIMNSNDEVLATIAVYHRNTGAPSQKELDFFERVSSLLRVIIENKNAESKIRLSNERYLLVTKATNDAIWDWDVNTNTLYWGEGIYTLFGFKPGYVDNSNFWEHCIHPDDRERVVSGLNEFINNNTSPIWEDEYRFIKPDGEYALVYDRGFLIFDHSGKITRMVGSMQDITDKKELEKKLLKQEVDKQKLIAQAVVNAQEKERAEIGKELHDNVNQILSTAKLYLELAQTDEESRVDLINRCTNNISDAINEIRTISRSLVPPSVGDLGLVDSVQDLVENIKATKKLHVEFYYTGSVDDLLDEKRKLMLFRIIQEQVNNVLKHASANNLVIELIADNDRHAIDLTISDDGNGFEMEKVRSKKGVGLSNIASRAQLFNGSVHIVTALGEGCKLKINVPISNI